jgi:glycosyltransferase involved in cell wall biosynthesis
MPRGATIRAARRCDTEWAVPRPCPEGAVAGLDIPPPERIAVGRGSAFVIGGHSYHPREPTKALAIRVGDSIQRVRRIRLPRTDVYERLPPDDPARRQAFRSGFVALLDLEPIDHSRRVELQAVLSLEGGERFTQPLGGLELEPGLTSPMQSAPPFPGAPGPEVAICMATHNPPVQLFRAQLNSLREQTHGNWICLISDDASEPELFQRLRTEVGGDPRFAISRSERRLGYYRNFERALSMAPAGADFAALCDQDDRWHPHKLERLLSGIGGAELAYSDARLITPGGELVAGSYWTVRRNNYTNFASLLLANSVTGAASLFRRELLDDALPFPPMLAPSTFHDHWLAVVALARGEIAYVDEPLWDYVQHGSTVIGHSQANKRPRPIRRHVIERLRKPTGGSRAVYYYDWHQQLLFGEVLRLRCWDRMEPAKRRTLTRLLAADFRVGALAWLLGRRARKLFGHDETLDRELFYGHALLRRRAVSLWTLGRSRPNPILPRDQSIPPAPEPR